jgi:hypothetical protein
VVIESVGAIVTEYDLLAVWAVGVFESIAVTVTELPPAVVGVPLMAPVAELIDSPPGSPVADHVKGVAPPVADIVAE